MQFSELSKNKTFRRSSVVREHLKPYWKSGKRPRSSRWSTVLLFTSFSKTLLLVKLVVKPLLVESSVNVIFYVVFLMLYAVIINYKLFWKIFFFQLRGNGENKCFKPPISSVFTTVASRLKSEQKEKEK